MHCVQIHEVTRSIADCKFIAGILHSLYSDLKLIRSRLKVNVSDIRTFQQRSFIRAKRESFAIGVQIVNRQSIDIFIADFIGGRNAHLYAVSNVRALALAKLCIFGRPVEIPQRNRDINQFDRPNLDFALEELYRNVTGCMKIQFSTVTDTTGMLTLSQMVCALRIQSHRDLPAKFARHFNRCHPVSQHPYPGLQINAHKQGASRFALDLDRRRFAGADDTRIFGRTGIRVVRCFFQILLTVVAEADIIFDQHIHIHVQCCTHDQCRFHANKHTNDRAEIIPAHRNRQFCRTGDFKLQIALCCYSKFQTLPVFSNIIFKLALR